MPTMPSQLAPNSARTYRLAPEGYTAARNRLLRQRIVLFAAVILFAFVLVYKMFGQTWQWGSIRSLLPSFLCFLIISGALASGLRKGLKRNQESWNSFELVVGEDFVIRKIKDFPELEIQRHEVTAIKETPTGLYVKTKLSDRTIGIARALVDYDDAKERLSSWMPLMHEHPRGWTAATRWVWVFPLITILLFALCFLSTNSWVVVGTGVPLLIGLSVSIWLTRRSVQTSAHMKRISLLTALPLVAIIAKLIQAIQKLR